MNPFSEMTKPAHARLLAYAVLVAHTVDEIFAALRMVQRTHHGVWLGEYFTGKHFGLEYVGGQLDMDLDVMKMLAAEFLGEE